MAQFPYSLQPVLNTDQGVLQSKERKSGKKLNKKSRNESEMSDKWNESSLLATQAGLNLQLDGSERNFDWNNPKDVDLYAKRMKPCENKVEVRQAS